MKGHFGKRKVKHTKKLKLMVTICLISSTLAPIFPGLTFIEAKAAVRESSLQTIRSNIVENELPSSTNSTETIKEKESEGEITSLVPDNVEPEKKVDSSADLTQAAESKITIADTGIVLKNDNTYLLMDNPENYHDNLYDPTTDIKGQGEYDENTIIEFQNSPDYFASSILYSEPKPDGSNNKIQQITSKVGTFFSLIVTRNSQLDIETSLDYGIATQDLVIGEYQELIWQPIQLNVKASKIGILATGLTTNVTGTVTTEGNQAGISNTNVSVPDREDFQAFQDFINSGSYGSYEGRFNTSLTAKGTGMGGSGAIFHSITLNGSSLNGTGTDKGIGILVTDESTLTSTSDYIQLIPETYEQKFFEATVTGVSDQSIGILSIKELKNYGGKVNGTSNAGNGFETSGIDQQSVTNDIDNSIIDPETSGSTNVGFGILVREVTDGLYHNFGDIKLNSGKVTGISQDGTGIAAGGIIDQDFPHESVLEIKGHAEKGQGIILANMLVSAYDVNPKIYISGTSNGESQQTIPAVKKIFQDTDGTDPYLPVSAGIACTGELYIDGLDIYLTATAPKEIDDSCGFYGVGGIESGIRLQGFKEVKLLATGDYGVKVSTYSVGLNELIKENEGSFRTDIDGRSFGIDAASTVSISMPNESISSKNAVININSSEGDGIRSYAGVSLLVNNQYSYPESMSYDLPVNISAKNHGINLLEPSLESSPQGLKLMHILLSIVNAKVGIKSVGQGYYTLSDATININSSEEGISLEGTNDYNDYLGIDGTSMDITSGSYGFKAEKMDITFSPSNDLIKNLEVRVTSNQYPIWIDGQVSISNGEKYDSATGTMVSSDLNFITTSKNLIPDTSDYPTFYVKDQNQNLMISSSDNVRITENYLTPAAKPFNDVPSTPYSIAAPFNIANYGNYVWTANRTDDDTEINVIQHKISDDEFSNELSTDDQTYDEARLTATRQVFNKNERIFYDEYGESENRSILHQINMLVRREEQYRVTYDGNGADGGDVPTDSNLYSENDSVNVAPQGNLTLTDHTFVGWLNSADGQIYQNPQMGSSPTTYTMGQSDVTFTAQWRSNSVVEELSLIDGKIPGNLNFGTHDIQYDTNKTFYATDDGTDNENGSATNLTTGGIGVLDTRLGTEGWSLTVKQLAQFKTSTSQELSSAELGFKVGPLDTSQSTGGIPSGVDDEEITLIPGNATELLRASNGQGKGTVTLPIERFTLKIPKTSAKHVGQNTTEVEWLLSNVP